MKVKGSSDTVAGPLGALLSTTSYPNQSEPVESQVKIYVCVLFVNSLMEDWPSAKYITGTTEFRTFDRRIQRGILYRIFSVGVFRIIQQLIGIFVGG